MSYIEDRNGCFHDSRNGRFVSKRLVCRSYGIDPNSETVDEDIKRALRGKTSSVRTQRKKREIENKFNLDYGEATQPIKADSPNHWYRLCTLVGKRKNQGIGFNFTYGGYDVYNIDRTLYFVRGGYADFHIYKKMSFTNDKELEEWLKKCL